ncbi:hypothetical protein DEO72_LG5g881 [Vigna unguiculata]|uniref:Uncharacterized protein n=1 Tax=Vigna unguiculata TaxID=3917 RepID=A0A4D6LV47_VIGUN|nr:hypothetical protein DEO72_LG5g881 [Vigna unguiculata]
MNVMAGNQNDMLGGEQLGGEQLEGEQLEGEQGNPPQVQASAESDQIICIRMSRVRV